jgi:CBS domain-containing protein
MTERETVRAKDLMRGEVATLAPDDTIETALALFEESGISGAPVVASGRLVGVLSLSDVSRTEHLRGGRLKTQREYELSEPAGEERTDELDPDEVFYLKDDYSPEVLGRELVGDWMTNEVVSVSPEASLAEVCRVMVERKIHRVFVAERGRLQGVLSTFDVVRHLARAGKSAPPAARGPRPARKSR